MKKLTIVALVVVLVVSCLVFTGCGKKEDKKNDQYEIALVTDVGNIDDKSFNQGTWEGVEAYAKEHNISYNYYKPSEDSTAARVETMKTAITYLKKQYIKCKHNIQKFNSYLLMVNHMMQTIHTKQRKTFTVYYSKKNNQDTLQDMQQLWMDTEN